MSLVDRCVQFRRQFPSAHINPTLLRLVYRKHGIKKKHIRWTKSAKKPDPEGDRKKLITVKRLLTRAKNDNYRIIYADETMFTRKTIKETEWALPKENMTVD